MFNRSQFVHSVFYHCVTIPQYIPCHFYMWDTIHYTFTLNTAVYYWNVVACMWWYLSSVDSLVSCSLFSLPFIVHIVSDQSDMNLCFQGLFLIMVTCADMHVWKFKRRRLQRASTGLLNKASHLTAFCAWDSSLHLPVTPAQLMRPGIGWNTSCALGDFV